MTTTILNRVLTVPHPPRDGAPPAADRLAVRITAAGKFNREVVTCNGVLILANEYAAGTPYAARRVEHWTR